MIRQMNREDRDLYMQMADEFYHSGAVLHPVPVSHWEAAWEEMMRSSHYVRAYLMEQDGKPAGYGMLSFTFSQESGGKVAWLEELYVRDEFRGRGLGKAFFSWMKEHIEPEVSRIRLEIEPDNEGAARLYKSMGFGILPYVQMVKEIPKERETR